MATASPKSKFDAAVRVIHSLPKDGPFQPSRDMMLLFYGYYKQATEGPCTSPKPSFWDVVKKAKWEAWSKLVDMDKETAMVNYVNELKKTLKDCTNQWNEMSKNGDPRIVEAMPQTQNVGDFMEVLGSFYEIVDEDSPMKTASVPNGIPLDDGYNTAPSTDISTEHETVEKYVPTDESVKKYEPIQPERNHIQSDESEDEFCDTSADLDNLELQTHEQFIQPDGPVSQIHTLIPVKTNHVRFADTNGNDPSGNCSMDLKESIQVAQGFPFISSDNVTCQSDAMFETNSPVNTVVSANKFSGDLGLDINVTDISANNSNLEGMVDEGGEPPDGGDRGRDTNEKSGQGGKRSGSSQTNLQGSGGRRTLLPGGGSGGGAGGQDPVPGSSDAVNEQIATVLVRLQQDMASVLDRLNRLETQSQQKQRNQHSAGTSIFNRWPFANRAGRAAFFFLIWPIIVHLVLSYFFKRRRKR